MSQPDFTPDDAVLRMLAGANFGLDSSLTLPSGTTLDADEAQAFTSAFEGDVGPDPSVNTRQLDGGYGCESC